MKSQETRGGAKETADYREVGKAIGRRLGLGLWPRCGGVALLPSLLRRPPVTTSARLRHLHPRPHGTARATSTCSRDSKHGVQGPKEGGEEEDFGLRFSITGVSFDGSKAFSASAASARRKAPKSRGGDITYMLWRWCRRWWVRTGEIVYLTLLFLFSITFQFILAYTLNLWCPS